MNRKTSHGRAVVARPLRFHSHIKRATLQPNPVYHEQETLMLTITASPRTVCTSAKVLDALRTAGTPTKSASRPSFLVLLLRALAAAAA